MSVLHCRTKWITCYCCSHINMSPPLHVNILSPITCKIVSSPTCIPPFLHANTPIFPTCKHAYFFHMQTHLHFHMQTHLHFPHANTPTFPTCKHTYISYMQTCLSLCVVMISKLYQHTSAMYSLPNGSPPSVCAYMFICGSVSKPSSMYTDLTHAHIRTYRVYHAL